MENLKNKNRFLVSCVCCIVLLLTLCYFGVNTAFKGTAAASSSCPSQYVSVDGYCCKKTYDTDFYGGSGNVKLVDVDGEKYCTNDDGRLVINDTSDTGSCSGWFYTPMDTEDGLALEDWVATQDYDLALSCHEFKKVDGKSNEWYLPGYCISNYDSDVVNDKFEGPKIREKYLNKYMMDMDGKGWISHANSGYIYKKQNVDSSGNVKISYYFESSTLTAPLYSNNGKQTCAAKAKQFYKVTYDINGGTDPNDKVPSESYYEYDAIFRTPTASPTAPANYKFKEWNSSKSGTGQSYIGGGRYEYNNTGNNDITIYAIYEPNNQLISFDANGGSGTQASINAAYGSTITMPSATVTRDGYYFAGWSTTKDPNWGGLLQPGASYVVKGSTTFYAAWTKMWVHYRTEKGPVDCDAESFPLNKTAYVKSENSIHPNCQKPGYKIIGWNWSTSTAGAFENNILDFGSEIGVMTFGGNFYLTAVYEPVNGSGNVDKVSCPAGQYYQGATNACAQCPAGSYCEGVNDVLKTETSDKGIESCKGGKTSPAGSKSESDCKTSGGSGNVDKVSCPAGQYYQGATNACAQCPAGSYCEGVNDVLKTETSDKGIESCKGGKTSPAGSKSESDCKDSGTSGNTSTGTWKATFYNDSSVVGSATCEKKASESGCYVDTPADPTKSGYTFDGWHSKSEPNKCSKGTQLFIYVDKAAWYACWTKNEEPGNDDPGNDNPGGNDPGNNDNKTTYTAKFDGNGGIISDETSKTCEAVNTTTGCTIGGLPTASKSGHTFIGWGTSSSCESVETLRLTLNGSSTTKTFYACYTKDSTGGEPGEKPSSPDSEGNVPENPKTGDIAIVFTWLIGLFAIGYTLFYFRKGKQN